MKRIEKIAKKQLDENQDAIDALHDKYVASLKCFRSVEEKNISEANLNIQKILTDVANKESDEVIADLFQNIAAIDDATGNLDVLDRVEGYLFEEIQERTKVTGLGGKKK